MLTFGFDNVIEVDSMFYSFKEAGNSGDYESNLTFEEFLKGIMDFPDILEQFS